MQDVNGVLHNWEKLEAAERTDTGRRAGARLHATAGPCRARRVPSRAGDRGASALRAAALRSARGRLGRSHARTTIIEAGTTGATGDAATATAMATAPVTVTESAGA